MPSYKLGLFRLTRTASLILAGASFLQGIVTVASSLGDPVGTLLAASLTAYENYTEFDPTWGTSTSEDAVQAGKDAGLDIVLGLYK